MSNKTQLQTNNTQLDALITRVNAAKDTAASLPEAGGGGGSESSQAMLDLLAGTLVEFENGEATSVYNGLREQYNLKRVSLPSVTSIGDRAFADCELLTDVYAPLADYISDSAFSSCTSLKILDLPRLVSIGGHAFSGCSKLKALVLRNQTVCILLNNLSLFGSSIADGTGYVYVPRALLDTYIQEWSIAIDSDRFRVIEDYTVDGTLTGELDYDLMGINDAIEATVYILNPESGDMTDTGFVLNLESNMLWGEYIFSDLNEGVFQAMDFNHTVIPSVNIGDRDYFVLDPSMGGPASVDSYIIFDNDSPGIVLVDTAYLEQFM